MRIVACMFLVAVGALLIRAGAEQDGDAEGRCGQDLRRAGQRPGQQHDRRRRGDRRLRQDDASRWVASRKALLHKSTFKVNLHCRHEGAQQGQAADLQHARPARTRSADSASRGSRTAQGRTTGISGTFMLTETFAGYGPFYATGAHKGTCNTSSNATPTAQWGSVTGSASSSSCRQTSRPTPRRLPGSTRAELPVVAAGSSARDHAPPVPACWLARVDAQATAAEIRRGSPVPPR